MRVLPRRGGLPGWLDTMPTLTADQTRLVDLGLVGRYALAPTWADGHERGFYTFRALRDGCLRDACTAARARPDAYPMPAGADGPDRKDHERCTS